MARRSIRQLKPLEAVQLFLAAALQGGAGFAPSALAFAHPVPFLHQEFFVLPVSLQIERGDDVLANQDRQREIAELALWLWHIGLEAVLIAEEEMRAPALDNKRIERRENVHDPRRRALVGEHGRRGPMLLLARAFQRNTDKLPSPQPPRDRARDVLLARRIEMADRIQRHTTL